MTDYPYDPSEMAVTEILPDDEALRRARRARLLDELEAADVDVLVARPGGQHPLRVGSPAPVDRRLPTRSAWAACSCGRPGRSTS